MTPLKAVVDQRLPMQQLQQAYINFYTSANDYSRAQRQPNQSHIGQQCHQRDGSVGHPQLCDLLLGRQD